VYLCGLLAEEMGDDEVCFFIVSAIVAIIGLSIWYIRLHSTALLGRRPPFLLLLSITPPLCFIILYIVLITWSDPVVRNDSRYIGLFLAGGAAWLSLFTALMPVLGISLPIDVLSQRNPAAAIATAGTLIGVIITYSLANIGEGPTIWTTIGPAMLATLALLVLWMILEMIGQVSEAITIDRDVASGLRLAGFVIATGLILGRAVAGDYESGEATIRDFAVQGWPALLLCMAAGVIQRMSKPTPRMPAPPAVTYGVAPAIAYLIFAAGWVAYLGKW
jgi:uncharacterized membrane protein YjfL (UPF0719 family)